MDDEDSKALVNRAQSGGTVNSVCAVTCVGGGATIAVPVRPSACKKLRRDLSIGWLSSSCAAKMMPLAMASGSPDNGSRASWLLLWACFFLGVSSTTSPSSSEVMPKYSHSILRDSALMGLLC